MNSPELPTPEEEKQIAQMIEVDIDFSKESREAINPDEEIDDATESETP